MSTRSSRGACRWNLNILPHLPGSVLRHVSEDLNGINVPWLYYGMLFATFAWHTEDNYFASINYMHDGAPKTWCVGLKRFRRLDLTVCCHRRGSERCHGCVVAAAVCRSGGTLGLELSEDVVLLFRGSPRQLTSTADMSLPVRVDSLFMCAIDGAVSYSKQVWYPVRRRRRVREGVAVSRRRPIRRAQGPAASRTYRRWRGSERDGLLLGPCR